MYTVNIIPHCPHHKLRLMLLRTPLHVRIMMPRYKVRISNFKNRLPVKRHGSKAYGGLTLRNNFVEILWLQHKKLIPKKTGQLLLKLTKGVLTNLQKVGNW